MHAAGLYVGPNEPPIVCEDIGRHNAVDKAIGLQYLERQQEQTSGALAFRTLWLGYCLQSRSHQHSSHRLDRRLLQPSP